MARYLARECPRCGEFFGVVVSRPIQKTGALYVNGLCALCGYEIEWKVIHGARYEYSLRRGSLRELSS